ncbi:MAG: hypothetical protein ABI771_06505 [Betaproteobacteria bacterium]
MGTRQRGVLLAVLLTATLSAAAWVRDGDKAEDAEVVAPRKHQNASVPVRQAQVAKAPANKDADTQRVHLEKLRTTTTTAQPDDAFAPRSWARPAAKAAARGVAIAPPPPPTAPPLPFVYMGRLLSDNQQKVFLTAGERNLIVREGDTVDAIYRVEKLSDAGVTFLHLPTGIRQELPISAGESQ